MAREPSNADPIELEYEALEHETAAAWLIVFQKATKTKAAVKQWMPKSQCEIEEADKVIQVPRWLVEKNGLEGHVR